jgi:hypothetical protein
LTNIRSENEKLYREYSKLCEECFLNIETRLQTCEGRFLNTETRLQTCEGCFLNIETRLQTREERLVDKSKARLSCSTVFFSILVLFSVVHILIEVFCIYIANTPHFIPT